MAEDFTEFNKEHQKETYKSLIAISTEAIKALILVNGGAAAGLVASLEKLMAVVPILVIQWAMVCFVVGLSLAILALFFGYFTQAHLHNQNMGRGVRDAYLNWRMATIVTATLSLCLFAVGGLMMAFNAGMAHNFL